MIRRKQKLLALTILFSAVYSILCLVVLREYGATEKVQDTPVTPAMTQEAAKHTLLHGGTFYRIFADRMQYYAHDPSMVPRFYQLALTKAPADYQNFFSYAYYLTSLHCCKEQAYTLLMETVRRCPTNPRMSRIAAACFLSVDQKSTALPYFRRALELDPSSAQQMYGLLDRNQISLETMYEITPPDSDAFLQLAQFLIAKKDRGKDLARKALLQIQSQQLDSKQRLTLIRLLLSAGYTKEAQDQASLAFQSEDSRIEALRYLADISAQNANWQQYDRFCTQIEKILLDTQDADQAAAFALQAIQRLPRNEGSAGIKQRLLRVINDYPRYAPAYAQMAALSASDSPEVQMYYWKQAVDLDPERLEYHKQLASLYLRLNRPTDAEKTYQPLLDIPETKKEAYLGIAQCKVAEGDRYQAIAILHQGIELSGEAPEFSYQLGQLYDSIGEFERAAHYYSEYGHTSSNKVTAFNLAGDAYFKLGRNENAREQYLLALSTEPNNQHAQQQLQLLK